MININPAHKGMLHRDLGVPQDQKIPMKAIEAAEHSSSPAVRKRAQFADNARSFKHEAMESEMHRQLGTHK